MYGWSFHPEITDIKEIVNDRLKGNMFGANLASACPKKAFEILLLHLIYVYKKQYIFAKK